MITKDNAELVYDISDEYTQKLEQDMDSMKAFINRIHRCTLVVFWLLSACFVFTIFVLIDKLKNFLILFGGEKYITVIIFSVFVCIGVILALYVFAKKFISRGIQAYDHSKNNLFDRTKQFVTIQCIYNDMMDDKLSILGAEESCINVKCLLNGKMQNIDMPISCKLNTGEKNIVRFLDEYIEITVDKANKVHFLEA